MAGHYSSEDPIENRLDDLVELADQQPTKAERRKYALLQAASLIFANSDVFDRSQKYWGTLSEWSVMQAEALLKEIERKES